MRGCWRQYRCRLHAVLLLRLPLIRPARETGVRFGSREPLQKPAAPHMPEEIGYSVRVCGESTNVGMLVKIDAGQRLLSGPQVLLQSLVDRCVGFNDHMLTCAWRLTHRNQRIWL